MSTNRRNGRDTSKSRSTLVKLSRRGVRVARKSIVTLGDLVTAACDVSGSPDAAALLLSPLSPLSRMLGRRIVIA